MKASLESLLASSLNELKDLNSPVTAASEIESPVEGLQSIDAKQIEQDVMEHIQDERYNDEGALRAAACDYFEQNELEHANLRHEIAEVRESVSTVVSSMEMLSLLTSMESLDDSAVEMANNAMGAIALQAGDLQAPTVETEDGAITTASMEGLMDFIKQALGKLKKWIKEKFENIAINMRRGFIYREVMIKRIDSLQKRLDSLPEEYGIPGKPLRYDASKTSALYSDNKLIEFKPAVMRKAFDDAYKLLTFGVDTIASDAAIRSNASAEALAAILVARDSVSAETQMKDLYKVLTKDLPISKGVTYGTEIAGLIFVDGSIGYRSRYRDVDWIMDLINLLEPNQLLVKQRRNGRTSGPADDVADLRGVLDVVVDAVENEKTFDYAYYNELCLAWNEANECYNRLYGMVTNMEFTHMTSELWRALDIACTSMFTFLDKAYYHTENCRAPYLRLIDSVTYVLEEQMKAYVAVNR